MPHQPKDRSFQAPASQPYPYAPNQPVLCPQTGAPLGPAKVTKEKDWGPSDLAASTWDPKLPPLPPPVVPSIPPSKDPCTGPPARAIPQQSPTPVHSSGDKRAGDPVNIEQAVHTHELLQIAERTPSITECDLPSAGTDLDINVFSDPDIDEWLLAPRYLF